MKSRQLGTLGRGRGELPCTWGTAGPQAPGQDQRGHGVREGRVKIRQDHPLMFSQELDVKVFGAKLLRRKACGSQTPLCPAAAL